MSDTCRVQDCDGPARWRWWNGMGGFGGYCDDHAREQLDEDPGHKDPITRAGDVSGVYVVPAGIQPLESMFPTIRSRNAFDRYLETDGEEPHQCPVSWCGDLRDECDAHDIDGQPPMRADGGVTEDVSEKFVSKRFEEMEYVCEDCGRVEKFDGLPVKIRSPIREYADCAICRMWLVRREEYWNGEIDPDEVVRHA